MTIRAATSQRAGLRPVVVLIGLAMVAQMQPVDAAQVGAVPVIATGSRYVSGAPSGEPDTVSIEQGAEMVLLNGEAVSEHSITSVARNPAGSPIFESGSVPPGRFRSVDGVRALPPGTYLFRCTVVAGMAGALSVVAARPGLEQVPGAPEIPRPPPVPSVPQPPDVGEIPVPEPTIPALGPVPDPRDPAPVPAVPIPEPDPSSSVPDLNPAELVPDGIPAPEPAPALPAIPACPPIPIPLVVRAPLYFLGFGFLLDILHLVC